MTEIYQRVSSLFKKYGIKSVTMDDIARELGISKKTLYAYTQDKNDLLDKIIQYETNVREKELAAEVGKKGDAILQLFRIMALANKQLQGYSAVFQYDLKKYYPAIHDKLKESSRRIMYGAIYKNIEKGIREGLYRKDLQAEVIAKLHLSRLEKIPEENLITIEEYVSENYFREVFEYHIRGIANEEGLKILAEILKDNKTEKV